MSVEIRDRRFEDIVGESVACELLASGFLFTEGPVWDAPRNRLLFSDIPGNALKQWSAGTGVSVFRAPSNMTNGMTWDREGRLLCCEHATSRVTRTEADGKVTVIASEYRGQALNSPNDIVVKSDGSIYFTDPTYGRMPYYGVEREPVLGFRGVYRVDADGKRVTLLADDFAQPNGLCFSADERRLFVNDTERTHIRAFDVREDGTLENGRVWAVVAGDGSGAPDGMKIDSEGNLYCCGPGGIHVFDQTARLLGVIRVPCAAANFNWGEEDLRSLFITASDSLYRVRVRVPGRRPLS
ncbi:MAG: SMP-30/gluconolactonase/LRE family protein [Burkholderiaceae bacterium]